MRNLARSAAAVLITAVLSCTSNDPVPSDPDPDPGPNTIPPGFELELVEFVNGLAAPLLLTAPANDERMFVIEQRGTIRIIRNQQLVATPFLDISARVRSGGEQGLLGLAFHPDYATNGQFFVNFTDNGGDTRIERFTVSAGNPDLANPSSSVLILQIDQPYSNHNGGMILFAPDGKLLIGMGDGGSGGDPLGHGQDRTTLLGDMLRIDVNAPTYSIPSDNPFVGQIGTRHEIWASGLRNPWRFSVDRVGGMLYIGDVGQGRLEEIDVAPLSTAGINYGWNTTEGTDCFERAFCDRTGLTQPVLVYGRSNGCSVIGGYVYRGSAVSEIRGHYFYSDYCNRWLKSFRYHNGNAVEQREWNTPNLSSVLSFGEDAQGELYLLTSNGIIYRLAKKP